MPVETDMQELRETVRELLPPLTAAIVKLAERMNGTPTAAAPITDPKRPPGRPRKLTIDEVKVVCQKVKDEKGPPAYFLFLKKFGAAQIADLPEARYSEFMAAADVLLAEKQEPEAEAEEPEL